MAQGERRGLTRSATDIVQSKLSDASVELEEERERLANATGSTEDGNLGQLIHQRAAGQHTHDQVYKTEFWALREKNRRGRGDKGLIRCGQRQRRPCAGFWKPT